MIPKNRLFAAGFIVLFILACNFLVPAPVPTAAPLPSPVLATATSAPRISQQVALVTQPLHETNQSPPYTINVQLPELTGSDDPRVLAFNRQLDQLVNTEVDVYRQGFLQNPVTPMTTTGSTLDMTYILVSQMQDLWSFKFDYRFYSDGAAHPGLNSTTLTYDLARGRVLALGDLFAANSNYLETIANYCIAELSKQPGFDGAFADGAKPALENYRDWNLTPDGILITFGMYQVAPGASGPQQVLVPYGQVQGMIDPQGPLSGVVH